MSDRADSTAADTLVLNDRHLVYRIDAADRIVHGNVAWDQFAIENGCGQMVTGHVVGTRLWDYLAGETTVEIYRALVAGVRAGRTVSFPFRCDAPDRVRSLEMTMRPWGVGGAEFETRTVSETERAPQPILATAVDRTDTYVVCCSWCKRVDVQGKWVEVEDAVGLLNLFDHSSMPQLTHGICRACLLEMEKTIQS